MHGDTLQIGTWGSPNIVSNSPRTETHKKIQPHWLLSALDQFQHDNFLSPVYWALLWNTNPALLDPSSVCFLLNHSHCSNCGQAIHRGWRLDCSRVSPHPPQPRFATPIITPIMSWTLWNSPKFRSHMGFYSTSNLVRVGTTIPSLERQSLMSKHSYHHQTMSQTIIWLFIWLNCPWPFQGCGITFGVLIRPTGSRFSLDREGRLQWPSPPALVPTDGLEVTRWALGVGQLSKNLYFPRPFMPVLGKCVKS